MEDIGKGYKEKEWGRLVESRKEERRVDGGGAKYRYSKWDNSRVPVEMWDGIAWEYEGQKEIKVLNLLQESM